MGIKPKGPLFLLHEVGRTEALLCAHRKACNRRPVWKTTLLTTNLFSGGILINVFIKATGFDASTILITSFESSSWRHSVFWKYYWLSSIDRCIRPFPCPRKKALAICVQSQNYSCSSVMLLSFSRNDYVAILNYSLIFLLMSHFLVWEKSK